MQQVAENLRDDALNIAMAGIQELCEEGGPQQLLGAMLSFIFPIARHQFKHVYRGCHKTNEGVFNRLDAPESSYLAHFGRFFICRMLLTGAAKASCEISAHHR